MKIKTHGRSIEVTDITFDAKCPVCGNTYSITPTRPISTKNAGKCQHGTFYVTITPMKDMIDINVQFQREDSREVMGATISDMTIAGQPYRG